MRYLLVNGDFRNIFKKIYVDLKSAAAVELSAVRDCCESAVIEPRQQQQPAE